MTQTQERHKFGINPERAEAWLNLMIDTMEGMGLTQSIKSLLIEKMRFLINKMAVTASGSTKAVISRCDICHSDLAQLKDQLCIQVLYGVCLRCTMGIVHKEGGLG